MNYSVLTMTVCVLATVAVVTQCSRRLIPEPEQNLLGASIYKASDFLYRARFQRIHWLTTDMDPLDIDLSDTGFPVRKQYDDEYRGEEPFAKARRDDKPLMVFIGGGWSQGARSYDQAVLGSREIAGRLNSDFVSVRVDLAAEPEWRGALLPISSENGKVDPGFAIWFLQPDGEIIDVIRRNSWKPEDLYNGFLATLSSVKFVHSIRWDDLSDKLKTMVLDKRSDEDLAGQKEWEELTEREQAQLNRFERLSTEEIAQLRGMEQRRGMQRGAVALLKGSSNVSGMPDIDLFIKAVVADVFETWTAAKYRVLIQAGAAGAVASLLDYDLLSSRTDLVDGGFFWLSSAGEQRSVEFGKLATDQAEMAAVLAHLWRATGDDLYLYHSQRALESVHGQFLVDGPWPSFLEVETARNGRSKRHSFGPTRLRLEFSAEQRGWAKNVGLVWGENPQMVPFLVSRKTLADDRTRLDEFIDRMQKVGDEAALLQDGDERDLKPGGMDHLDSAGTTVARAIEAARTLGDERLLELALKRSERLDGFRAGLDEVSHSIEVSSGTKVWLGDFTAFADAMMEVYAATGDESRLLEGKRVLERALLLFATDDDTVFLATTGRRPDMGALDLDMPSIVDDGQPPALPALVRLAFRYGAVTGDAGLLQVATRVSERYSPISNQFPASFASFIASAQEVMISGFLLVAGEDSVARAREIGVQNPGTFVVPALSGALEPGVYRAVGRTIDRVGD